MQPTNNFIVLNIREYLENKDKRACATFEIDLKISIMGRDGDRKPIPTAE